MKNKNLIPFIRARLKNGAEHQKIYQELIAQGWKEAEICEALYDAIPQEKLFFKKYFFSFLVFFCFLAIAVLFFITNKHNDYYLEFPIPQTTKLNEPNFGEQPALSDPDFFNSAKQQYIEKKLSFVEADLSAMILRVYKNGSTTLELPINSKGREGSWWETPAGIYKINSKEPNHFSGMGHVWMPWSMNFQGNFYIHGHPYYPDGTPTPAQYTGGCIRLSTENAKKVYEAVNTGIPLLVFEKSFTSDNFVYRKPLKDVSAGAYIAGDLRNNQIFAAKEQNTKIPIASITKLVSALVITEYINLDSTITVPKSSIVFTSKPRLKVGEQYKVYDLLFPLLMESSNEAAEAIAQYYGRELFIKRMNEKAVAIGMKNTTFTDPSGASPENISTAEDLFMLAKYIYNNRSFVFHITSGKIKSSAYGKNPFPDIVNFNNFINHENYFGGKNGKTNAAKETNLSVFDFPVGGVTRPVVLIVISAENAEQESQKLLEYITGEIYSPSVTRNSQKSEL